LKEGTGVKFPLSGFSCFCAVIFVEFFHLEYQPLPDNLNIYHSDSNFFLLKPGQFSYTVHGNSVWRKPHAS